MDTSNYGNPPHFWIKILGVQLRIIMETPEFKKINLRFQLRIIMETPIITLMQVDTLNTRMSEFIS